MKKRTLVAVALAVVFVLAMAAPAFAQYITHDASYNFDGDIALKKQVGHLCNTGAEMKQTIYGQGKMQKVMDVEMVQGKITVDDTNDWVTAPDAVRNLTVTSVIELCTPPKFTYEDAVVSAGGLYGPESFPFDVLDALAGVDTYNVLDFADEMNFDAVNSRQIWAVQVEANAGFSGNLHQSFEAAYGGYTGWFENDDEMIPDEDADWLANTSDTWRWVTDDDGVVYAQTGPDYVGDYFTIEQFARTSMGVVKRYIDISSPWSHGYLYVDSVITGMAEITESFSLDNLPAGVDATSLWWHLF